MLLLLRGGLMKIELIYFEGCPNFEPALRELKSAILELGIEEEIIVWERSDQSAPNRARNFGSPSILIDREDLFGADPSPNPSCRMYGVKGFPTRAEIIKKLSQSGVGGEATRFAHKH